MKKSFIFATIIGNMLEWYDFMLFASFAPILSELFFPLKNSFMRSISLFSVLAVGYLMRPLGGILLGYLGDRINRRFALIISILLMAVPTLAIGLLPTYQSIGLTATLLFTLCRLAQGFSVGGELPGTIIFLAENSPKKFRGFFTSFAVCGIVIGMIIGGLVATLTTKLLSYKDLLDWGWRIPYLCSVFLAITGIYLRVIMLRETKSIPRFFPISPIRECLRYHKVAMLKVVGIQLIPAIGFGIIVLFMPSYLNHYQHLKLSEAQLTTLYFLICFGIFILIAGLVADMTKGRRKILLISSFAMIITAIPLYWLINLNNFFYLWIGIFFLGLIQAFYNGNINSAMVDIFPDHLRYTPIAFAHGMTFSIFGGTAPLFAVLLIKFFNTALAPSFYLVLAAIISWLTVYFFRIAEVLPPLNSDSIHQ